MSALELTVQIEAEECNAIWCFSAQVLISANLLREMTTANSIAEST